MTLKNRAALLDKSLENILYQQFDPMNIEINISDGGSNDCVHAVLQKYKTKFGKIIYAHSDRSVLPFQVKSNCPAVDINAQIKHCTECEVIIRKDPEIMFTDRAAIHHIIGRLHDEPELLIYHNTLVQADQSGLRYYPQTLAGYCIAFRRDEFIKNGGIEERFSMGFACEDTALIRWWENNKKAEESRQYVIHLWHEPPHNNPEYIKLHEKNRRLFKLMIDYNIKANKRNPNWGCKEMIKGLREVK